MQVQLGQHLSELCGTAGGDNGNTLLTNRSSAPLIRGRLPSMVPPSNATRRHLPYPLRVSSRSIHTPSHSHRFPPSQKLCDFFLQHGLDQSLDLASNPILKRLANRPLTPDSTRVLCLFRVTGGVLLFALDFSLNDHPKEYTA